MAVIGVFSGSYLTTWWAVGRWCMLPLLCENRFGQRGTGYADEVRQRIGGRCAKVTKSVTCVQLCGGVDSIIHVQIATTTKSEAVENVSHSHFHGCHGGDTKNTTLGQCRQTRPLNIAGHLLLGTGR